MLFFPSDSVVCVILHAWEHVDVSVCTCVCACMSLCMHTLVRSERQKEVWLWRCLSHWAASPLVPLKLTVCQHLSSFWINLKSYNITNEFINLKNIYKVKLKLVLGSFPLKLSGFLPWFSPLLKIHCYKQHASDSRCCSPGANFLKPCFP